MDKLQPERWLYFNYAPDSAGHPGGQGLALSRMPLIADALAAGDLLEVLPRHRIDTPLAYWLMVGPRSARRPEVKAFAPGWRRRLKSRVWPSAMGLTPTRKTTYD